MACPLWGRVRVRVGVRVRQWHVQTIFKKIYNVEITFITFTTWE